MPRLFFAIRTPEPIREELRSAQRALSQLVGSEVLRLEHLENSHITLAFLGEAEEAKVPRLMSIATVLFDELALGPLTLQLQHVVPNDRRRPKVIWATVSPIEPLRALHQVSAEAAQKSGITIERREYKPHLTLARIRQPIRSLPEMPQVRSVSGVAPEAVLIESELGFGPPKHAVIARFVL